MSISALIYSRVSSQVAAFSLRIYPNKLPQAVEFPAMVYQIIDDVPIHAMKTTSGTARARIQVDIYTKDYDQGETLRDSVCDALSRYSDLSNTPPVTDILVMDKRSMYEDVLELERQSIDFQFLTKV